MGFEGFVQSDFDIFELPDFEARMPALKANITPKLQAIGEELAPLLSDAYGHPMFVHVAQHLRRSVNPSEETWCAFSRNARAYKPYVHTRVAINGGGLRIVVHLEDYASDKPHFARMLKRRSSEIKNLMAENRQILSFDKFDPYGKIGAGRPMKKVELIELATRLSTVKSQHANFGFLIPRATETVSDPKQLLVAALEGMKLLQPIYELGLEA